MPKRQPEDSPVQPEAAAGSDAMTEDLEPPVGEAAIVAGGAAQPTPIPIPYPNRF